MLSWPSRVSMCHLLAPSHRSFVPDSVIQRCFRRFGPAQAMPSTSAGTGGGQMQAQTLENPSRLRVVFALREVVRFQRSHTQNLMGLHTSQVSGTRTRAQNYPQEFAELAAKACVSRKAGQHAVAFASCFLGLSPSVYACMHI